jgi:hypothetical protein
MFLCEQAKLRVDANRIHQIYRTYTVQQPSLNPPSPPPPAGTRDSVGSAAKLHNRRQRGVRINEREHNRPLVH